jgi:ubiquitin-conjugating enzyme E2 J2
VASILIGLQSFMIESSQTVGSVESTPEMKQRYAADSLEYNVKNNKDFCRLFPELVELHTKRVAAAAAGGSGSAAAAAGGSGSAAAAAPGSGAAAVPAAGAGTAAVAPAVGAGKAAGPASGLLLAIAIAILAVLLVLRR